MTDPLPLGTPTVWGQIVMVGILAGERYYWMRDKSGGIAMMPADVVERRDDSDD